MRLSGKWLQLKSRKHFFTQHIIKYRLAAHGTVEAESTNRFKKD